MPYKQTKSRREVGRTPGCIAAEVGVEPSTGAQALAGPSTVAAAAAREVLEGQYTGAPPEKHKCLSASKSMISLIFSHASHHLPAQDDLQCTADSKHSPLDSPWGRG